MSSKAALVVRICGDVSVLEEVSEIGTVAGVDSIVDVVLSTVVGVILGIGSPNLKVTLHCMHRSKCP